MRKKRKKKKEWQSVASEVQQANKMIAL